MFWSNVGAFVHLYHVWGMLCFGTAMVFGWPGVRRWREAGGTFSALPWLMIRACGLGLYLATRDWMRLWTWVFSHLAHGKWPHVSEMWADEQRADAGPPLTLFFGISLGGWGGFLTAFYWSERNRAWMSEEMVLLPGAFVLITVVAHLLHMFTAFPDKPWLARMISSSALWWVVIGGLTGGVTL